MPAPAESRYTATATSAEHRELRIFMDVDVSCGSGNDYSSPIRILPLYRGYPDAHHYPRDASASVFNGNRRKHAQAQIGKQRPGSVGARARLHGYELWLRSGGR